jgi:hypothetical protein
LKYRQLSKTLTKFVKAVSRTAIGSAVRTAAKRLFSSTAAQIITMGNSGASPQLRLWRIISPLSRLISPLYKVYNDSSSSSLRSSLMGSGLDVIKARCPELQLEYIAEGEDILAKSRAENDRLILCTGHFGLGLLIFRVIADYLDERGYRVCFIVKVFDEIWRVGMRGSVTLSTVGANTFIKARSALETGSIVCVAPDHLTEEGHEVSTNVFKFAWRLRASVLFFGSRLDRDGRIVIDFVRPFHHTIKTHNEAVLCADEFRQFVAKRTGRALKLRKPPAL